jgi:hypothetical protein
MSSGKIVGGGLAWAGGDGFEVRSKERLNLKLIECEF